MTSACNLLSKIAGKHALLFLSLRLNVTKRKTQV